MFQPGRMAAALVCLCATAIHARAADAAEPGRHGPPMGTALHGADAGASDPVDRSVSPSAVPAPANAARWEVRTGDVTLSRTVERWAQAAGHKLKWDAARNFLIGASDVYVGSFEGALEHLLSSPGIRHSDFPLEACIYANVPPLVRITRQGEQSGECTASATP